MSSSEGKEGASELTLFEGILRAGRGKVQGSAGATPSDRERVMAMLLARAEQISCTLSQVETSAQSLRPAKRAQRLDDVPTALLRLRAGSLRERREALRVLTAVLEAPSHFSGEHVRAAVEAIEGLRDVELTYELLLVRRRLPSLISPEIEEDDRRWRRLRDDVAPAIEAFWEGEGSHEPFSMLSGEERALLLVRSRDLDETSTAHLQALFDGPETSLSRDAGLALLSSLRFSGDRRWLPTLASLLEHRDAQFVVEAARSLARIEDPRVIPILGAAYAGTLLPRQRIALGGALALQGDRRAYDDLRLLLGRESRVHLLGEALEAFQGLGQAEDGPWIATFLEHEDPVVIGEALRALRRFADSRVLPALAALRKRATLPVLLAEAEETEAAIRARAELRGEPTGAWLVAKTITPLRGPRQRSSRNRVWTLLRARLDFALGRLWLLVGREGAALRRFELAIARLPKWALPLSTAAMYFARRRREGEALVAFRRAREMDPSALEADPLFVRTLALTFLRRAEHFEREGRMELARSLLRELMSMDLRHAPSVLRIEIERRFASWERHAEP